MGFCGQGIVATNKVKNGNIYRGPKKTLNITSKLKKNLDKNLWGVCHLMVFLQFSLLLGNNMVYALQTSTYCPKVKLTPLALYFRVKQ